MIDWISQTRWRGGMSSGVATPRHPQACAHIKFTCAQVKIIWKAKVKDQAWSRVSCGREASIQVRLNEWNNLTIDFRVGVCARFPSRCVLRTQWVCPCCAHVTCLSGYATGMRDSMHSIPSLNIPDLVHCSETDFAWVLWYRLLLQFRLSASSNHQYALSDRQQIPLLPYMVTLGSGDCDKHLYEFQRCYHSNSYIWTK